MAGLMTVGKMPTPRALVRIDKGMDSMVSPKTALHLLQNSDLPPPIKLLTSPDYIFLSSISKIYGVERRQGAENNEQLDMYKDRKIMKALRLSQTRAREAEKKLRAISKEKAALSNLLVDESLQLFAHRQLVSLLEFQLIKLQQQEEVRQSSCGHQIYDGTWGSKKWFAAVAFCLAIAGMGFAYLI